MSRKVFITIMLALIIIGIMVVIVKMSNSNSEEQLETKQEEKSIGPALNGPKEEVDSENQTNTDKKNDVKKSSKTDRDQTQELTENATFYLKTIEGSKTIKEDEQIKNIATKKMIKQIAGADSKNSNREIDVRNTSIKFENTHNFKDKVIKGTTFKYDLIVKSKDKKNSDTTKINQQSAIKFIKEDDRYKLDEISK
jgi:cell division protein FtsN